MSPDANDVHSAKGGGRSNLRDGTTEPLKIELTYRPAARHQHVFRAHPPLSHTHSGVVHADAMSGCELTDCRRLSC